MFQLALGFDGLRAGLMLTPLFVGNIGIKPLTSPILRRFGFRNVLIVNGLIQVAALALCATIGPDTPATAMTALLCIAGASRSMHFTALGTLPFADVPPDDMSMANLIFSVSFQASFAFGIGLGSLVTGRLVSRTGRTAIFPSIALIPVVIFALLLYVARHT